MRGKSRRVLGPVYWWSLAIVLAVAVLADKRNDWNLGVRVERTPKNEDVAGSAAGSVIVAIQASENGMFYVNGMARDTPLRFLVDTGATYLTLRYEDALAMGLSWDVTRTVCFATANGRMCGVRANLKVLGVGGITMEDVEAAIAPAGAMKGSLLGMSFLGRLKRFEFTRAAQRLVLEQ